MAARTESDGPLDLKERYCRAITNLTGKIVPVLQQDGRVIAEAYSNGLIAQETYLSQDREQQAKEILTTIQSKIKMKSSFYNEFLQILKSTKYSEHIADLVEEEVELLRERGSKRKSSSVDGDTSMVLPGDVFMPSSDATTTAPVDAITTKQSAVTTDQSAVATKQLAYFSISYSGNNEEFLDVPSSTSMVPTQASMDETETDLENQPHRTATDRSAYVQNNNGGAQVPPKVLDGPSKGKVCEAVPEESRPFQDTEKISSGVEEESCNGDKSTPVFQSQGDAFDKIQRMVENEKLKVAVKDKKIRSLEEQIVTMDEEKSKQKKKYEEEIEKKEEDLKRCKKNIADKGKEIEQLKEKHEKTISNLHQEYRQKIESLKKEQAELNESTQQRIRELEQQGKKAEEEIEELQKHYEEIIQEEKTKHAEEVKKLEEDIERNKTDAKDKEDKLKLLHQIQTLKLEHEYRDKTEKLREEINTLKQEKTEAEAHAKVCEAEMEKQQAKMAAKETAMKAELTVKEVEMKAKETEMKAKETEMKAQMEVQEANRKVQEAEKNAEIEIHKSQSENQLALRKQAQEHEQEKQELTLKMKIFYEAQRSLPTGTTELYSETLSVMQQMSISSISTSSNSNVSVSNEDANMEQSSVDDEKCTNK